MLLKAILNLCECIIIVKLYNVVEPVTSLYNHNQLIEWLLSLLYLL